MAKSTSEQVLGPSGAWEPHGAATAYAYDELGDVALTTTSADGAWRRRSSDARRLLAPDGSVWSRETRVADCSDASIVPLTNSVERKLFPLSAACRSLVVSTGLRGVATVRTEVFDRATCTATVVESSPAATNDSVSVAVDGCVAVSASHSSVTNTYAYDSLRQRVAETDGRGGTRRTEYAANGLVSATVDALGKRTAYAYDQFGRLVQTTDPLGNAVNCEYDALGRKTYEGGATYPVRYTYDVFGNKASMTTYRDEATGNGDTTTWLRDFPTGVVTNKLYADGKGPCYRYDAEGRTVERTWARGIVTSYAYDAWGSLTNTVYSDSTSTVSLAYDALGRQTNAVDAAGTTTLLYDDFGAVTNETVIGVAGTNTIERFYDNFGRSLGYSLNGDRQTTLAYDPATGRLAMMQIPSEQSNNPDNQTIRQFSWNYLPGSDLKSSLAYPNGLTASWQYDANNQLLQVCNAFPTNVISQYDYTYDAAGRRVSCAKSGSAFAQNDTLTYAHNNRSELTNAVAAVDSDYRYAYAFDDIGNRETSFERGTNSVYAANNLNQYTAVDDFAPQFDDDGNQTLIKTSTGIWSVTYNGENRPIQWTLINSPTPNSSTPTLLSMSYDRIGRRVTKNDQRFVYDGYLQIANFEHQTSNIKLQTFIWDPTEPIATRPLAWLVLRSLGEEGYYTHDGNKNVSEVVAENSGVAAHYEYMPFGAVSVKCGASASANPWCFSSEYVENETVTVYYNYRHYEPLVGRWMSRDPIEEEGCLNVYLFCVNSASKYFDVIGLVGTCCCKLCLYSATPAKTFNDGNPLDATSLDNAFGHTWVAMEKCNTSKDQIGPFDGLFSFGPGKTITLLNFPSFLAGKIKGRHWRVDDYKPPKYVVVKQCWELDKEACAKLRGRIQNGNKYPRCFTTKDYCTSTAIKFVSDNGGKSIPDANGPVKQPTGTEQKPNPKTLAENMVKGGGTRIPNPTPKTSSKKR